MGWSVPRSLHWAKIVDSEGYWRWTRAHRGIRGRLLKNPPTHVYQTVCRFQCDDPPRGRESEGYFLGGPLIFDADISGSDDPFSLWQIADAGNLIEALDETLRDRGNHKILQVLFSGARGVHVLVDDIDCEPKAIRIPPDSKTRRELADQSRERYQNARSIGNWCSGWDWKVSADLWRVSRVPWSMHGKSALRALPLKKPFTASHIMEQLKESSPFSRTRRLRVRITRSVPLFTFIDEETYGPFRKGWATKVPIAVALHLMWQGSAKPREQGPAQAGMWFEQGWQTLFRCRTMTSATPASSDGGAST